MEVLFLLLGGTVLAIPVMAIAALVRTGRFRKTLEDQYLENLRSVSDLKREIADLRRALADVSLRVDRQGGELSGSTKAAAPAVSTAAESISTKDERSEQIQAVPVSGQ
jgi:hypothetical protein